MHILITGAAGFIGQLLAHSLLNDPEYTVLLTDITEPAIPAGVKHPENARTMTADLVTSASTVVSAQPPPTAVYILHGIMSSGAESSFDHGLRVNLDSTRLLLDALRHTHPGIRTIYASSQAVYGRPFPPPSSTSSAPVHESTRPTPESSYGTAKLICEALLNDYTRRGFLDGHILRFPTVAIRPGAPTAAASSFISGIIREPLQGRECVIPLRDRGFVSWVCSPRTLVRNLRHALTVPAERLPRHDRVVLMPGGAVSVQEMRDVLERVGGRERLALVREVEDPVQEAILRSWPTSFDNSRAYGLGYVEDPGFEQAVMDYMETLGGGCVGGDEVHDRHEA